MCELCSTPPPEDIRRGLFNTIAGVGFASLYYSHGVNPRTGEWETPQCVSMGMHCTRGAAEVIVMGADRATSSNLIVRYWDLVLEGRQPQPGLVYEDFWPGLWVRFERVAPRYHAERLALVLTLYPEQDVPVLQLVWTHYLGRWPWDAKADEHLRRLQPLLTESGKPQGCLRGADVPP